MGHEILYCARCGNRISGEDFDRSLAFRVGNRAVCSGCIRKELSAIPSAPDRPIILRKCRRLRSRRFGSTGLA